MSYKKCSVIKNPNWQAWWCASVVSATWEAEVGGLPEPRRPGCYLSHVGATAPQHGQQSEALSQSKAKQNKTKTKKTMPSKYASCHFFPHVIYQIWVTLKILEDLLKYLLCRPSVLHQHPGNDPSNMLTSDSLTLSSSVSFSYITWQLPIPRIVP